MKKCTREEILHIIVHAAKEYEERMRNKNFLIIYQENTITKTVSVGFRDMNFLHMTGVKSALTAKQFYMACIHGKLSVNDFEIDNKGKVQQKIAVLPYLSQLLYNNCMVGNFINSGICIQADYFVGNTRAILSVGFRRGKNLDYPVTLYNEDIRKLSHPTCKVLAIFVKEEREEFYTECSYLSKEQVFEKLPISDEIEKLIQMVSKANA